MNAIAIATIVTVLLAILFDFTNGFHDAANATSTVIATRSLKPKAAVVLSAIFNFLPAFIIGTAVANTIAKTVNMDALPSVAQGSIPMGVRVTLAALLGAILWNLITWSLGLPSSSSHALIGGLIGAGISAGGLDAISASTVQKTAIAIIASPVIALLVAAIASFLIRGIQRVFKLDDNHEFFRWGQVASSAFLSWGHGSNDAQKTMGVIAATLYSAGYLQAEDASKLNPSTWVIFGAHAAIALGTLYGGWRIIETMGLKITHITRASGMAANLGAITSINGATALGVPISTTHAAASSVVGSGLGNRQRVHLGTIGRMVMAWVITLPMAGIVGFFTLKATVLPDTAAITVTTLLIIGVVGYLIRLMFTTTTAQDVERALPQDVELMIDLEQRR